MIQITYDNKTHLLLDKKDKCPICDTDIHLISFIQQFQKPTISSCCGAAYHIKCIINEWSLEYMSDDEKKMMEMINSGDYILFNIELEWIEPIKQTLKELNKQYIDDMVASRAYEIIKSKRKR